MKGQSRILFTASFNVSHSKSHLEQQEVQLAKETTQKELAEAEAVCVFFFVFLLNLAGDHGT